MPFIYEVSASACDKTDPDITITGYDGETTYLQVPDRIDGLPVRRIAPWAFANRAGLIYVSLPDTLVSLGRFAFYSCRNLKKAVLADSVTEYGDGVFRQCRSLSDLELRLTEGHYGILREILSDTDSTFRFFLRLPDGEACLTFPDYLAEYEEDTRARQMHYHIEGIGFSYRECVSRSGIDFRGYDNLFARVHASERHLAAQIAMDRLLYPCSLTEEAAGRYKSFLRENAGAVLCQAIETGKPDWLRLLTQQKLAAPEALETAIRFASEKKEPEYVSLLMRAAKEAASEAKETGVRPVSPSFSGFTI